MNFGTRFLLLLANGFVVYYYWASYQHGMSAQPTLIYLFLSLIAINLALFLGRKLGERSRRK